MGVEGNHPFLSFWREILLGDKLCCCFVIYRNVINFLGPLFHGGWSVGKGLPDTFPFFFFFFFKKGEQTNRYSCHDDAGKSHSEGHRGSTAQAALPKLGVSPLILSRELLRVIWPLLALGARRKFGTFPSSAAAHTAVIHDGAGIIIFLFFLKVSWNDFARFRVLSWVDSPSSFSSSSSSSSSAPAAAAAGAAGFPRWGKLPTGCSHLWHFVLTFVFCFVFLTPNISSSTWTTWQRVGFNVNAH